jgi:hypothetical protein
MDLTKVKCFSCHPLGHKKCMCPNNKKPSAVKSHSALFGEALFSAAVLNNDVWISDTGATQHMTKFKDYFVKYTVFDEPKMITLGNRQTMIAHG